MNRRFEMAHVVNTSPNWAKNMTDPRDIAYRFGVNDALDFGATRKRPGIDEEHYYIGYAMMAEWLRLHEEWITCNREFGTSDPDTKEAHAAWRAHSARKEVMDYERGFFGRKENV